MSASDGERPHGLRKVACFGCRHLVTTYDRARPYACRLFAIESRRLPSIEVRENSGEECRGYEPRARRRA